MSNEHIPNNPIMESGELQAEHFLGMTLTNTVHLNESNDGNLINNNLNLEYVINNIKQPQSKNEDIIQYARLGKERIKYLIKDENYIYDIDMNNETEQSFLNKKIVIENINNVDENKKGHQNFLDDVHEFSPQINNSSFHLFKPDNPPDVNNTQNNNIINNQPTNAQSNKNNQKSVENEKSNQRRDSNGLRFIYNPIGKINGSVVPVRDPGKNINKFKQPNLIKNKPNNPQFENEAKNREKLIQLIPNSTIQSKISEPNIQDNNLNLPNIGESLFNNETIESVYV